MCQSWTTLVPKIRSCTEAFRVLSALQNNPIGNATQAIARSSDRATPGHGDASP